MPRNAEVDQGIHESPFGGDPAKRCNANLQNALAMGWDALQVTVRQTENALTWYEALLRYNSVQSAYVHNYTLYVFTSYEQESGGLESLRAPMVVCPVAVVLYFVRKTVFYLRGRREHGSYSFSAQRGNFGLGG